MHHQPHRGRIPALLVAVMASTTALPAHAAVPATWITGVLMNSGCGDQRKFHATTALGAMQRAGFAEHPFVDPNFQFVTASNADTTAVITINPVNATRAWMDVFTTSATSSDNAVIWRDNLRSRLVNGVLVSCPPVLAGGGTGPAPGSVQVTTLAQFKSFPASCGGFARCTQVARDAIIASGLTDSPVIQNPSIVIGNNSDTKVVVECVSLNSNTLISTWAASLNENTFSWASNISTRIQTFVCP
jgi:hypothetical protein